MAKNADPIYFAVLNFVRYGVFLPFGGVRVLHGERMPMSGPVILAANHASFADPPVVAVSTNRRLNFMAKAELFKPPVFGPLIRRIGAFPIQRDVADTAAVKHTLALLADGEAVLVFPEGGRGDGKTLGEANKGVTLLAMKSGAPVLPVGIAGTHLWLPQGAKFPRRARLTVAFGEPFTFSAVEGRHGKDARNAFGDILMEKIAELVREGGQEVSVFSEP
ncbi:MAG: 1-acyl-sn-glycerol-3-phosphate acyltransferase [Armatimonadota bacterium]|nr:1-acyl-sn-glycerol-3-phosphate acyltransferase [Armatimonadota bacterium]